MPLLRIFIIGAAIGITLLSCTGKSPSTLGITDSKLTPCPSSPNCISSDSEDATHKVAAFQLDVSPEKAWQVTLDILSRQPRTKIIKKTSSYLHIEYQSAFFGFVDDVELNLRSSEGVIAVRSASRMGYSDFGVNRHRVDVIRAFLNSRGILK